MKSAQYELHAELETVHWWFRARLRIVRKLLHRLAPPSPDTTVVDIGCGTGGTIAALNGEYNCVGIDPSPDAIRHAARRFPGVNFISGKAPEDLGDIAARAAVFLLMDVLEHVPDDFIFISELLAALRPGGHLILTVPADMSLWSEHDVSFGHYRRYDSRRLQSLWEGLDVTAILLSHFNSRLFPLVKLVRGVKRIFPVRSGRKRTDLKLPPRLFNRLLERIFTGESKKLLDLLDGNRAQGYARGASLIAILRRGRAAITARRRLADIPPDAHEPKTDMPGGSAI